MPTDHDSPENPQPLRTPRGPYSACTRCGAFARHHRHIHVITKIHTLTCLICDASWLEADPAVVSEDALNRALTIIEAIKHAQSQKAR